MFVKLNVLFNSMELLKAFQALSTRHMRFQLLTNTCALFGLNCHVCHPFPVGGVADKALLLKFRKCVASLNSMNTLPSAHQSMPIYSPCLGCLVQKLDITPPFAESCLTRWFGLLPAGREDDVQEGEAKRAAAGWPSRLTDGQPRAFHRLLCGLHSLPPNTEADRGFCSEDRPAACKWETECEARSWIMIWRE